MLDNELCGTDSIVVETQDLNNHVIKLVRSYDRLYLKLENEDRLIRKLVIKPNMWLYFLDGSYDTSINLIKPCHSNLERALAFEFSIDPLIFNELIDNDLISYSKGVADLYDLPPVYARDIKYHHRDYKWSRNKEKVLKKLRSGNFN